MSCPTCDHTLNGIGHGMFHCPRCGTLTNCQVEGAVTVPSLVERVRRFGREAPFGDWGPIWHRVGIQESIGPVTPPMSPIMTEDLPITIPGFEPLTSEHAARLCEATARLRANLAAWLRNHNEPGAMGCSVRVLESRVLAATADLGLAWPLLVGSVVIDRGPDGGLVLRTGTRIA